MDYFKINRLLTDPHVKSRELAESLGVDAGHVENIVAARKIERWNSRYSRPYRIDAGKFLKWRERQAHVEGRR